MEPISPKHITVTDPFWAPRIRTVADIVLPYQWRVLHDQVPGAPKSSCIANFQKAAHAIAAAKAGGPRPTYPTDKWYYDNKNSQENAFMGWVFQDSDLYKWLEAAAYAIPYGNRAYLTEKSREAVEIIAAAQETDGYLDTLYSINGLQNRFTNLKDYHELYCFGHLAQAACARWTMQGERDLLDIACRAADCICRTFGRGKRPGYPGHPLAELALVQLYEVTGKADYLQTADFFIRTRGTRPLFFDRERGVDTDGSDYIYNQAHCPLTAQTTAVGHAVRGVYLYAGAAAVAEHTGNRALQAACETLWQDLCRTKLYVTGALGQTAVGEAFGPAYYLPNDLAYGESCASAGLVFFAQRLYRCHPHAAYGTVAELALWNTIAGAMSADGCHFYYANPLEAENVLNDTVPERKRQALRRQNWFGCACCPPNVARVTAGIGQYGFYADDSTLAIELLLGAQVDTPFGQLQIISALPESGDFTVKITWLKRPFTLRLRLPDWCKCPTLDGQPVTAKDGYYVQQITAPTILDFCFAPTVRLLYSNARVGANAGRVALSRGGLIYALETQGAPSIHALTLDSKSPIVYRDGCLLAAGTCLQGGDDLYTTAPPKAEPRTLRFIPFCRRLNDKEDQMAVWVRTAD